nr:phosphoesterase [uncultured Sulfurimonas sp.]
MNNILVEIDNSKHVMIVADAKMLPNASALYSCVLQRHKKVSLVCCDEKINEKYSFLPWFDKIRSHKMPSSDFILEVNFTSLDVYKFLKKNNIKINNKIATALYAGLLQESENFSKNLFDGIIFAVAKELIECGADYQKCYYFMIKRTTLAVLRLKSMMLKNMTLHNSAKAAVFFISLDEIKSSGAKVEDCYEVMKEALNLPYVELSVLLDNDNNVLKLII